MLTISKPLSAGQAQAYHAEEFGNARENYYTRRRPDTRRVARQDSPSSGDCTAKFAKNTSSGSPKASTRSPASSSSATKRRANT